MWRGENAENAVRETGPPVSVVSIYLLIVPRIRQRFVKDKGAAPCSASRVIIRERINAGTDSAFFK